MKAFVQGVLAGLLHRTVRSECRYLEAVKEMTPASLINLDFGLSPMPLRMLADFLRHLNSVTLFSDLTALWLEILQLGAKEPFETRASLPESEAHAALTWNTKRKLPMFTGPTSTLSSV